MGKVKYLYELQEIEMTEKKADLYDFEYPNCGHRWTVPEKEIIIISQAIDKWVRCPNCQSGRVLYKKREG